MIRLITAAELDCLVSGQDPVIVKLDVEGHEAVVIAELLKSAHAKRIEAIFYEVDERWIDRQAVRKLLEFTDSDISRNAG